MSNNILADAAFACSGCGACAAVCPHSAVSLKLDSAGFFAAAVDGEKCVDCGLCQQVCTRYDENLDGISLYEADLYALQSRDAAVVKQCSSGGISHELMMQTISRGGKVIGAVYNTRTDQAEHVIADRAEQIGQFDGSKYLQSDPQHAFRLALQDAKKDPRVRYTVTGTPCQIAGLAKAAELLRIRSQFLLIEIFCHGVPTYKVWNETCARIRKKTGAERFDSVRFRYKKDDWHSYCLRVDAGEKTYFGSREKELFWQVFFENILLGDSCYRCRMRKEVSLADIRLGDYWGSRFQHRNDGVSAVFACTDRGKRALEQLMENGQAVQLEATDCAEMLRAQNMDGYHQQALHDRAMDELRTGSDIRKAIQVYRKGQTSKQKLKRGLLLASSVIPDALRAKLRKAGSSYKLRREQ